MQIDSAQVILRAGPLNALASIRKVARLAAISVATGLFFPEFVAFGHTGNASEIRQLEAKPLAAFIAEASHRFDIPEAWLGAIMRVESAGNARAISSAGAMGLMQLMPGTWDEMRLRYQLGNDPFDAHDNILAGAAYLRELHDRFGSPGFLAAYNAGPGRYLSHLEKGRELPLETISYVNSLAPFIADERLSSPNLTDPRPQLSNKAPLFVKHVGGINADERASSSSPSNGLFVIRNSVDAPR